MSSSATNANKQQIKYDPYDSITISFMNVDVTKFGLLKTIDKKGIPYYIRCYDNKAFILIVDYPKDDIKGESMFLTFGLKEGKVWNDSTKKFTKESNGEYEMGIKLISQISETSTNVFDSANPMEKKLIDVLDGLRAAVIRDLVAFDEVSEAIAESLVRPLYSRTTLKDEQGNPRKLRGSLMFDETKSPVWNLKCKSTFVPGYKWEPKKVILPENRMLATQFYKFGHGRETHQIQELLNTTSKGVFFIKFAKETKANSGWGARAVLESAVIRPLVRKVADHGESEYMQRLTIQDESPNSEYDPDMA
jgi:hypothetical protein